MGTSNFSRGNTSRVYEVLMDEEQTFKECSECEHKHYEWEYTLKDLTECENSCEGATLEERTEWESPNEWAYDDLKEYIRERAEQKVKSSPYSYREEDRSGNSNQYNEHDLFSFSIDKNFGDINVDIKIIGQIVGAYYEGASLDFEIEFNGENYTDNEPCFEWLFEYKSDLPKGMQVIQNRNAIKWAEKEVEKMKTLIEEVFTEVSQPLNVVATSSNGETIYEKSN